MDVDAVVVGGGPAGLAAATRLAELGGEVLVVDASVPFNSGKPCGGYIPLMLAERLGAVELCEYEVSSLYMVHDGEEWIVDMGRVVGCNLRRRRLIDWMLREARRSGAMVQGGCLARAKPLERRVFVEACGEKYTARVLIAADGAASRLGAWIRGRYTPDKLGVAVQAASSRADVPRGANAVFFGSMYAPSGYAWVFPKRGYADIGVGALASKARGSVMPRYLEMVAVVVKADPPRNWKYAPVPLSGPLNPARGLVLLAGDAAGHVSPLTGEGVRYAVEAGWMAAEAAWGYLRGMYNVSAMGLRYRAALWRSFYPGLWLERRLMEHFISGGGGGGLLRDPGARRVVAMLYTDSGGQVSRLLRGLPAYVRSRLLGGAL